mmetsp:Transcript_19525/g.28919  ORF Transcript_19525/g.28919 Transcript_19525/m.28919 type:complete len:124 (-) Transcript_19525:75-446(-)|eukprot:CAMPEP_0171452884 /NCGR_PEP_ID=MMETSP0945-20130129/813_1 /TAXON_ID=109269 /ORGANISM="Vaucheria litorea, Strain CCMP2940" /LENGTH=123 /DNA_ID=CAMNT_0011977639 /DNA_START=25 /DNA_END=396 /DNA_ORIENTATION=-
MITAALRSARPRLLLNRTQIRKVGGMHIHDQNNSYPNYKLASGREGWEIPTAIGVLFSILIGLISSTEGSTSVQDWAMQEAIARNKAEEMGMELKYGVHYSNINLLEYEHSESGMPVLKDDEE